MLSLNSWSKLYLRKNPAVVAASQSYWCFVGSCGLGSSSSVPLKPVLGFVFCLGWLFCFGGVVHVSEFVSPWRQQRRAHALHSPAPPFKKPTQHTKRSLQHPKHPKTPQNARTDALLVVDGELQKGGEVVEL